MIFVYSIRNFQLFYKYIKKSENTQTLLRIIKYIFQIKTDWKLNSTIIYDTLMKGKKPIKQKKQPLKVVFSYRGVT